MDHLEVLREKVARLRSEIAEIQQFNERFRFGAQEGAEGRVAHAQRQERLQQIQEELIQLASLGRKTLSIEEMKENHRSRLHVEKKVS